MKERLGPAWERLRVLFLLAVEEGLRWLHHIWYLSHACASGRCDECQRIRKYPPLLPCICTRCGHTGKRARGPRRIGPVMVTVIGSPPSGYTTSGPEGEIGLRDDLLQAIVDEWTEAGLINSRHTAAQKRAVWLAAYAVLAQTHTAGLR